MGERLELRLTHVADGGAARDLVVRADGDATVTDLAAALRPGARPTTLYSARAGRLPDDAALAEGLLRDGDVVLDTPVVGRRDSTPTTLELCVVGGPDAGRRVPLGARVTTVGRGSESTCALEDPSLSRRHVAIELAGGRPTVADLDSRNGTAVGGRRLGAGERHTLAPDDLVEAGRTLLQVRPAAGSRPTAGRGAQIRFNRMPRVARRIPSRQIRLPAPPARPTGPRLPLAAAVAPLVLGVVLFLVTGHATMLLFSALSPVMLVATFVSDRRGGRATYAREVRAFRDRAARLRDELADARHTEVEARRALSPDAATLCARATELRPELWERRRFDEDFLSLRAGSADQPATFEVELAPGGEPEERVPVEELVDRAGRLSQVPVTLSLPDLAGVGLAGDAARVDLLGRWLTLQAAILHSPRELRICAAVDQRRLETSWAFLPWLPHVSGAGTIAIGADAGDELLRALVDGARAARADQVRPGARAAGATLLVVDEAIGPSRAHVDELLTAGPELGIHVLWLGSRVRDVPGGCGGVVELRTEHAAMDVTWAREGRRVEGAVIDGIGTRLAEEVARALAPVRDVTDVSGARAIPDRVALLDTLGLPATPTARDVSAHWDRADRLVSRIGVGAEGIVELDLRRDGPHGLVAGTTGAGKSELLQSLVAGLAVSAPPERLGFLFVDYKGGTAFKDCLRLPHTLGIVTDLDEHLAERALMSLNAELRRRETILNAAGERDLVSLERRQADAPPSLVIVVDEFAALRAEVPAFVDGIVDIAQRGRSLGVHLLLATQRPAGIVSDAIRANANLRIALRMQDAADSEDVVGDRAASRLGVAQAGRAFVRTGHGALTELQSAYGAATRPAADDGRVDIGELRFGAEVRRSRAMGGPTDLERLVDATSAAAAERQSPRGAPPWLPALPARLDLEDLDPDPDAPHVVPIGRVDEPRRQRQDRFSIDLAEVGSVMVFGATRSGKTTLLHTVALQLARAAAPSRMQVYGLDFAGHGLSPLLALPHCGDVVSGDDEERVTRLLRRLVTEIDRRGQMLADAGVGDLTELAGEHSVPRIVLLVDQIGGLIESYGGRDVQRLFARLVADGRAAGVHVVATADRRGAVPHAILSTIACRVGLRMAGDDELATLGFDPRTVRGAELPPGRGFVGTETLELQVATLDGGALGAIEIEGQRLRRLHRESAPPVPRMPEVVAARSLRRAAAATRPVLGLEGRELDAIAVDLADSTFLVTGPYRSGKSTALATLVRSALDAAGETEVHLLAPRRSPLVALSDRVTHCARGGTACEAAVQRLQQQVSDRSPEEDHPLLLVVLDDVDLMADGLVAADLETVLRHGRDVGIRVLAACERGQLRGFSPVLRELRKDGSGLLLEPDGAADGELLGVRLPLRGPAEWPPGRGYLVADGVTQLVQVALDPPPG